MVVHVNIKFTIVINANLQRKALLWETGCGRRGGMTVGLTSSGRSSSGRKRFGLVLAVECVMRPLMGASDSEL